MSRFSGFAVSVAVSLWHGAVAIQTFLRPDHNVSHIVPPDTSLDTLPVAYYGANWNRSKENIEILSKIQIVALMHGDGPCWRKCCPEVGPTRCGRMHDASKLPGCSPDCDQIKWQSDLFSKLKSVAKKAGRKPPHGMLYLNAVYSWPFDKEQDHAYDVNVLDVEGEPHAESQDAGLYPSYFFDFGRKAGQDAWLGIVKRAVVNGGADGVYVDNYDDVPFIGCGVGKKHSSKTCLAKRNGKLKSDHEEVTQEQVDAYIDGKNKTLWAASKLVGPRGSFLARQGDRQAPPLHGGNMVWINPKHGSHLLDPMEFIAEVKASFNVGYTYIVVGSINQFSNPQFDEDLKSQCDEDRVALFLLAIEPGLFLLCNGWDETFERKLGKPQGDAMFSKKKNTWTRTFQHGTTVSFDSKTRKGSVIWASDVAETYQVVAEPPPLKVLDKSVGGKGKAASVVSDDSGASEGGLLSLITAVSVGALFVHY